MLNTLCSLFTFLLVSNIYSFSIQPASGSPINLSAYQGKKILLVNTATNSPRVDQIAKLEQLHQLHGDSVVIIAFPSNSFGHEPGTNAGIDSFLHNTYNVHFLVSEKVEVTGTQETAIYDWVTHVAQNGRFENGVHGDFYKFLIDEDGYPIGVFAPSVDPMSPQLITAITTTY